MARDIRSCWRGRVSVKPIRARGRRAISLAARQERTKSQAQILSQSIVINELLAHTDPPDLDYIELFNYSTSSVNLVGCTLSDDPSTNKYMFQVGSVIPPMGFTVGLKQISALR